MQHTVSLATAGETVALGVALARTCPWADGPRLLYLSGELGAGKTTLAAALLEALGVTDPVRSPSYALLETYALPLGVALHLDCFRLVEPQELEQLGLRDQYRPDTLWVVEWPERGRSALPRPDLAIELLPHESGRLARIDAASAAGEAWLSRLIHSATSEPKLG
jgi:tRNA threonylcarbamoyl adenosine modification protein YjeE